MKRLRKTLLMSGAACAAAVCAGAGSPAQADKGEWQQVKTKRGWAVITNVGRTNQLNRHESYALKVCDRKKDGYGAVAFVYSNGREIARVENRLGRKRGCTAPREVPADGGRLRLEICAHNKSRDGKLTGPDDINLKACREVPVRV